MSSFFNGSLLDGFTLTKAKFEGVIGLGATQAEVRRMFCVPALRYVGKDTNGLDVIDYCATNGNEIDGILNKWCMENYGLPYNSMYYLIQEMTVKEFEDAMMELGVRGNPSAIAIMNEVVRKKENNGIVQVNFVNSMPLETEDDKEDD